MAMALSRETLAGIVVGLGVSALILTYGAMRGEGFATPDTRMVSGSLLLEKDAPQARSTIDWNDYSEMVQNRRLPVVKDGKRVFDAFKRPADLPPRLVGEAPKPQLAIVVSGLGFNRDTIDATLKALPLAAAVSIAPDAPYSESLLGSADSAGREIWVDIGSRSLDMNAHPGLGALELHAPATANIANLQDGLGSLRNYIGVTLAPDSAVANSIDDMEPVLQELQNRGLGLARLSPSPSLTIGQIASRHAVPFVDGAIDVANPPLPELMTQKMNDALSAAQTSGWTLLVLDAPNAVTVKTLNDWLQAHQGAFDIVPPSALAAAIRQ